MKDIAAAAMTMTIFRCSLNISSLYFVLWLRKTLLHYKIIFKEDFKDLIMKLTNTEKHIQVIYAILKEGTIR